MIKKETNKVCQDLPIIASSNIKDKNIFYTMEFNVNEIQNKRFKVLMV